MLLTRHLHHLKWGVDDFLAEAVQDNLEHPVLAPNQTQH
jgi:hypothetical protein